MKSGILPRRPFIKTLLIGSGSLVLGVSTSKSHTNNDPPLKVLMIYNNVGKSKTMESKWGLSIIIENNESAILFDTGGEPKVLKNNLDSIDYDVEKITDVVISHNHWDHLKGLSAITEAARSGIKVHVPKSALEDIKLSFPDINLEGVTDTFQLCSFAWSTGELSGKVGSNTIHEQSVIVRHEDRILVFTGCSHPGIAKIVEKAKSMFSNYKIQLVAGGFHMLKSSERQINNTSEKLKSLGVQNIGPSHCTGEKAIQIFREQWKDKFVDFDLDKNQILI